MSEDFAKAHIKGHMRGDHYVRPYERGGPSAPLPAHPHPSKGENGKPVLVKSPHHASTPSTWTSPDAVATFVPGGDAPLELAGVPLRKWKDHPRTDDGWEYDEGVNEDLEEPVFHVPVGKHASAGVVIEEADGRVWLTAPTNAFGGYHASLPKGTADEGMSLQATAIREAFEETGLRVKITGFIGDYTRTTSVVRMYRAVRVSGSPVYMGWESQAMILAPRSHLYDHLNGAADWPIAEAIGAGPAPAPPENANMAQKPHFGGLFGKK